MSSRTRKNTGEPRKEQKDDTKLSGNETTSSLIFNGQEAAKHLNSAWQTIQEQDGANGNIQSYKNTEKAWGATKPVVSSQDFLIELQRAMEETKEDRNK